MKLQDSCISCWPSGQHIYLLSTVRT